VGSLDEKRGIIFSGVLPAPPRTMKPPKIGGQVNSKTSLPGGGKELR